MFDEYEMNENFRELLLNLVQDVNERKTAEQTIEDYGTRELSAVYEAFGPTEAKACLLDEDRLEGYYLYPAKNDYELGEYLARINGVWDRIPKKLHAYFDIVKYGYGFRMRSAGSYCNEGFIFHDSNFNINNPWEA